MLYSLIKRAGIAYIIYDPQKKSEQELSEKQVEKSLKLAYFDTGHNSDCDPDPAQEHKIL